VQYGQRRLHYLARGLLRHPGAVPLLLQHLKPFCKPLFHADPKVMNMIQPIRGSDSNFEYIIVNDKPATVIRSPAFGYRIDK
jgi:hypothetical protein